MNPGAKLFGLTRAQETMMDASMIGKVCLVTGASSGLGRVVSAELASRGATVVMVARDERKALMARDMVVAESGSQDVEMMLADLSSLAAVRQLAEAFLDRHDRLDLLVNNAGAINQERHLTQDGHELTFGVNHLAHFLLTRELTGALKAAPSARVITVSSNAHRLGKIPWKDLTREKGYAAFRAYGTSKLANILFTRELARRMDSTNVRAYAVHPGPVATSFGQNDSGWFNTLVTIGAPVLLSPEEGARTIVQLCTSPEEPGPSGGYWTRGKEIRPSRAARSQKDAARLWELSEQLVGLR